MDSNQQITEEHDVILETESVFGYVPSSSVTPNCMAQQDEELGLNKKWWNDTNTKLLITEFKNYYKLWKNGRITKKKTMWQKVADALNNKGLICTAEQVENRYKTLQRGYRRSCGIQSRTRNCRRPFQYENELSQIFMQDMSLLNENPLNEEESSEYIVDQESAEEDTQDNFNIFEEVSLEESAIPSSSFYTTRSIPRVKYRLTKEKSAKTSVDVLIEIKELMKKVELRRQIRHEQNLKVAVERNEILKRKNKLMEQMLKKN